MSAIDQTAAARVVKAVVPSVNTKKYTLSWTSTFSYYLGLGLGLGKNGLVS